MNGLGKRLVFVLAVLLAGGMWSSGCRQSVEASKTAHKVERLTEIRQFVQIRFGYQQTPDYYSEDGKIPALDAVVAKSGLDLSRFETTPAWADMNVYGDDIVIREKELKDGVRAVGRASGVVEFVGE